MKVMTAELVISAVNGEQFPQTPYPEVALAGRSNVGKSSFINKMINRKQLARTSSKPGKTRTLNFYCINDRLHIVDVPGYGFAKVSKQERAAWGRMIESYMKTREQLRGVVLLVDSRHMPTADDKQMYAWLKYLNMPVLIVATKGDKIPKSKHAQRLQEIKTALRLEEGDAIVLFSAETGLGKEAAWAGILQLIQ